MSSHLIHKSDERLFKCWKEAMRRNLLVRQIEANTFKVSSFSRKGLYHRVEVLDEQARCSCESTYPQCSHISSVLAIAFPVSCGDVWESRENRELAEKRLKVRQTIFQRLLRYKQKSVVREFKAKAGGSFDEAIGLQRREREERSVLITAGSGKTEEKINGIRI